MLAPVESRHDLTGKHAQLLDKLVRRQSLGPMNHEIFETGVFRLDRLDTVDDLARRAAEPGFLPYAFAQGRNGRGRAGRAPGAALLVGITHKAERRKPFEALVVSCFAFADRAFLAVGDID